MVTGKGRVRLLGEPVHRLRHAVEEERLRLLLAAVAVGRGHQFLGLGHGERGEEVGEDGLQRAAQPDVKEVRQVGVADVVVVGRVGGPCRAAPLVASAWHASPANRPGIDVIAFAPHSTLFIQLPLIRKMDFLRRSPRPLG